MSGSDSDDEPDTDSVPDSLGDDSSELDITGPDDQPENPRVVVITGLSGSGKSTALASLEDVGFFCIDNLPVPLLSKVLELAASGSGGVRSLAFVVDTRERMFLEDAESAIEDLRHGDARLQMIFLEADEETLVRRFSETRRRHPLTKEDNTLREAIRLERDRLEGLRARADAIVDTTDYTVHDLKALFQDRYAGERERSLNVTLLSFGFKHGLPNECDLVFDVRFLENPYFIDRLRDKSGRDDEVRDFVLSAPEAKRFLAHVQEFAEFVLPLYEREGKSYLTVGIGCTGGQHRSVAVIEELANLLSGEEWDVRARHRDVDE